MYQSFFRQFLVQNTSVLKTCQLVFFISSLDQRCINPNHKLKAVLLRFWRIRFLSRFHAYADLNFMGSLDSLSYKSYTHTCTQHTPIHSGKKDCEHRIFYWKLIIQKEFPWEIDFSMIFTWLCAYCKLKYPSIGWNINAIFRNYYWPQ